MELQALQELATTNQTETFPQLPLQLLPQVPFSIKTNNELAEKLRWKSAKLLTLLGRTKCEHYSVLYLKKKGSKKNGKLRILHNPDNLMRVAQYKILKEVLEKIEVPEYVYAFEKNKSIPAMAALHVGKEVIVSLDLKDFFTSIKQFHVDQLFQHLGFGPSAARTLSELCTYKSFVPQGALTSPKLSNIVTALTFGPHIRNYCEALGLTVSIYADDITISADHKLDGQDGRESVTNVINFVTEQVNRFGFKINREKIKVMKTYQRQYVCGAVVNQKVNMQKTERHKLRAIVHNCTKNGLEAEAAKSGLTLDKFVSKTMGRLNWFAQLNPEAGEREKEKFKQVCADQITCPTAETESVKEVGSLDSLPEVTETAAAPW